MSDRSFEFDVTSDYLAQVTGEVFALIDGVAGATLDVNMVGPGGGNPCVTVSVPDGAAAANVAERLSELGLSWVDEDGEVHDHTPDFGDDEYAGADADAAGDFADAPETTRAKALGDAGTEGGK